MCLNLNCHSIDSIQKNIKSVSLFCKKAEDEMSLNSAKLHLTNPLMEPEHLFKKIRMIWSQLEDIILEEKLPPNFNSISESNEILEKLQDCLFACRDYVTDKTKSAIEAQIKLFRRSIFRFHEMEEVKLSKLNSSAVRKESSGICQYFHTYISMQWYLIILEYSLFNYNNKLKSHIAEFMNDLTVLSFLRHKKTNNVFERESDTFLCPCIKTIWVCIQLLLETHSQHEFWIIFNDVLKEKEPAFSLWLLSHIAKLQGFDETGDYLDAQCKRITPNLEFVELKLRNLFNSDANKTELVHYSLLNIEPLINVWWSEHVKVSIFQLLWEYFYKTLNVVPEDTIPTKAVQILITTENLCTDPRLATTAFQLYVGMLAKYLRKHGNQWFKLKGRIYSRLPVKKSLGNQALYNVFLLFICLAPVDFEELTGRISSMLENLTEDQKSSIFIWNLYCGLVSCLLGNYHS